MDLGINPDERSMVAAWDRHELATKIQQLMSIRGLTGILVKVALLGGLKSQLILSLYSEVVCPNASCWCNCSKLHAISGPNDLVLVIISDRLCKGQPDLAILPNTLWKQLRALDTITLEDIAGAQANIDNTIQGLGFDALSDLTNRVLGGTILDHHRSYSYRRGKTIGLKEIHSLAECYCEAWEHFGIVFAFE
jgi:hypothetical protein